MSRREKLVFLDVETTGLDPARHHVWEMAYAVGERGEVRSTVVAHALDTADPAALRVSGWADRAFAGFNPLAAVAFEADLREELTGATLVAANPAFDAAFLAARWGQAPWHYRLLDVETYAMGALGWDAPRGLRDVRAALVDLGFEVPEPSHAAGDDVATARACFYALRRLYNRTPEEETE